MLKLSNSNNEDLIFLRLLISKFELLTIKVIN